MKLVVENVISDFRRYGIQYDQKLFDTMNEFIDLENSYITKMDLDKWQDVRDKVVLIVDNSQIIAAYGDNHFMYNPKKIKIGQAPMYDVYEVTVQGTHVQNRRQERRDYRKGLSPTKGSRFANAPTSSVYLWDKDWDPEVNKVYYMKKLAQRHVPKYRGLVNDAYDIMIKLMNQRKERLTGKQSEYTRIVSNLFKQISAVEDEIVATERNFNMNPEKLEKEIKKLAPLVKTATGLYDSEEYEYKRSGKRKPIPYAEIEK